ncbi:hypothetical protein BGX31_010906 [Mortierella sp. GBA43]|nr:hypothetical protein BGX31_010906 [Mortierella sp. GBA43]
MQDDSFWVKVICMAQDLPQTMVALDGTGLAMDKGDPRAQGQITASKVEHWLPMQSNSNAGDVVFRSIERLQISCGVVDGVPEHVLAEKRSTLQNGVVIEYQLGLRLNSNASRRARQGDELPLPPQVPLIRCFDEHQLSPIRRSPKADVASMPLTPEYVFYLRKSAKSIQAEIIYEQEQEQRQQSMSRRVPAPLQAQGLRPSDNDSLRSPIQGSPTAMSGARSLRSLHSTEDLNGEANSGSGSPGQAHQQRLGGRNVTGAGSPSSQLGADGNIRIPRRMESAAMGPTSPTRTQGNPYDSTASSGRPSPTMAPQQGMANSRTPTPEQVAGRNRSPSVGQVGNEHDSSRSSTPERPSRVERQRATSPVMTHGPSPLSLAAVMLSQDGQSSQNMSGDASAVNVGQNNRLQSSAPMSVRKNSTQGTDIVMNKGVIRSSRLMNSKQYRYSFIPKQGGEEVDISDIIEDILGEEGGDTDEDDNGGLQILQANPDVTPSHTRAASQSDRDRLELLTNSSRSGDTLLRLEKVLDGDDSTRKPRSKRDSDVEIQVASVASITTRSASPMLSESSRGGVDSMPGSPRSQRPASPFGMMAKPTLLSSTSTLGNKSSPLKESSVLGDPTQDGSSGRSFSPIPRRLQSPSPAMKPAPNSTSLSPNLRPASPANGRISPIGGARPGSSGSVSSVGSARNRSASASAAESRLASMSNNSSTTSLSSSSSNKEWLLSSDYNAGMQDLLTLVRAGRSSSMSSAGSGLGGMRPLIGKDGKIVALPSTIKASILSGSGSQVGNNHLLSRSRSPSLSQLQSDTQSQQKEQLSHDKNAYDDNKQSTTAKGQSINDRNGAFSSRDEQTKMMLMMLNELTLQDVKQDCHPDVYDCWKDVDADLDRVERELDELLVTVKTSVF